MNFLARNSRGYREGTAKETAEEGARDGAAYKHLVVNLRVVYPGNLIDRE